MIRGEVPAEDHLNDWYMCVCVCVRKKRGRGVGKEGKIKEEEERAAAKCLVLDGERWNYFGL